MSKRIVLAVAAVAAFILSFAAAQRLLMPKYMDGVYEGRLVAEYYTSEKCHDVIFIGDCELYENVSPAALWEGYGIPSYIRGSAQQTVWQSYYLLEETLKYETPQVAVFSVLAMMYDEPQSEAYNRLHLDGMRLSPQKLATIGASMTEGEAWITYLVPLLRYHDRWREAGQLDIEYFWGGRSVSHNGFMVRCDVRPAGDMPVPPKLPDYRFGENACAYLDKMVALCEANGVELLLVKAPSLYPHWYEQWDEQIVEYAETHGLEYLNLLALSDEIGLDFQTDTYDGGLHLNVCGAEKVSAYLGPFLRDRYALPDRRGDAGLAPVWAAKLAAYDAQKDAQLREIAEHGKIVAAFFADGPATGQPSQPPPSEPAVSEPPAEPPEEVWSFTAQAVTIVMGQPAGPYIGALGEPQNLFEAPSCAFDGIDRIYTYPGFQLYTFPKDGADYVLSIQLTDDSLATEQGLYIGRALDDMLAAYGGGYEQNQGEYAYRRGPSVLAFLVEDGEIVGITWRWEPNV